MKELKYVGKEKVRLLGPQIVTGKAKYTGDFKQPFTIFLDTVCQIFLFFI